MARRRGLGTVTALAGLGLLVLASPILHDRALRQPQAPAPAEEPLSDLQKEMPVSGQEIEPSPAPSLPAIARPVAPETIAPLQIEHDRLERIDARQPLSAIGQAHIPSDGPAKEMVLHRPLATAAGTVEAMGYRIVLPGLLPTPAAELCGDGQNSWPCGIHARTAFRNFLGGRALACVVPPTLPSEPVIVPCLRGKIDAGAWLVEQGWARADPADGRYARLSEEARKAGRGLYGAGPATLAPFSVTVPQATDEDLSPETISSDG